MTVDKKAYNKEYQRTHRAQCNAARKKWAKNHPEEARELIKLSVLENSDETARSAADTISEATGADVVAVLLGHDVIYVFT